MSRPVLSSLIALALAVPACAGEGDARSVPSGGGTPPPPTAVVPVASAPPTVEASAAPSAAPTSGPAAPAAGGMPSDLNVLVISIDSLRGDMPWQGYDRDIAPVLTKLSKSAVTYSRFYSISSYTAMSLGGLLAGRYPSEVERSGYFFGNYPDSVLMFPELLQKAGVKTLTAHAHFYFDQKAGFRQGFDVYKIVPDLVADNHTDKNVTAPQHLALAEEILGDKANTSGRFFAWFHFLDPHDEYMPHEGIGPYGKKPRDRYDAEVTFVDQHVGKLLDWVALQPWGKKTAVIITSDHGEAFGEHKMFRHGFEIYEMLVHVPCMIIAPGITPRTISEPRSAIDLPPTILEMEGAPAEPSFPGKSLVSELYGGTAEPRDVVVDLPRTSDNDRRRALIHGNWKILSFGDDDGFALFDLATDPGEEHDLARKKENKDKFDEMRALYKAKSATIKDRCPKHTDKLKDKKKRKPC